MRLLLKRRDGMKSVMCFYRLLPSYSNSFFLLISFALLVFSPVHGADESLCARVKIEIKQELTLERQAFVAHMRISNELSHIYLQSVSIEVKFTDEDGNTVRASYDPNDTEALFFIRLDSLQNIEGIDGTGTVGPSTTADIHWLIIPALGASNGLEAGKLYYVGARLSYIIGGEEHVMEVTPDYIFVKPMPELALDYFIPRYVYGDDAFTPEIEPPVPFSLGVRVKNNGSGVARNMRIASAQPKIIENEQGLLIGFTIQGSEVNGKSAGNTLLVDFGDIAPGASASARWIMACTLSGEFVEFNADFSHADELGGELTSLLTSVDTHFLVRDVLVDLPGRDLIRDFLALGGGVYRVYETDGEVTEVLDQSGASTLQFIGQTGTESRYILSTPVTEGFMYAKLPDPHNGEKIVKEAVRSDGKRIKKENAWLSKTRKEDLSWEHFVNLFDANTAGSYTLVYDDVSALPQPPVLQFIPDRTGTEGVQLSFIVEASDPNGTIPSLSASPLPAGAGFTDQKNGIGVFDWTPKWGQGGRYEITFVASDGVLTASQRAVIIIGSSHDTDGDGMDDAWEMFWFGTLDRDGTGDYDGDGVSDLDEFLNGTNPADAFRIPLHKGFNLVGLADAVAGDNFRFRMQRLGDSFTVEKALILDPEAGSYITMTPGDPGNPDVILSGGEGVIVYALEEGELTFGLGNCAPFDLHQGLNLVGVACPPEGYTAFDVLDALGEMSVSSMQRYNPETGAFESAAIDGAGMPVGVNFPIVPGEGYFIHMKEEVIGFSP